MDFQVNRRCHISTCSDKWNLGVHNIQGKYTGIDIFRDWKASEYLTKFLRQQCILWIHLEKYFPGFKVPVLANIWRTF